MYAPSLVDKPRDLMNRFMIGASDMVKEEYRMTMLVDDIDMSCLTTFDQ